MHISIEGIDGVGKTTTAKLVASKLGFEFIDKPLHFLFDENGGNENYIRIRDIVNVSENRVFTSWFYGLSNIYVYEKSQGNNIVTDRHILSNYAWSGTDGNSEVYDTLIKKIDVPALSVILYAEKETLLNRINGRSATDTDIRKVEMNETIYKKMVECCEKYNMPYITIDSSKLTPDEVAEIIIAKVRDVQ